MAGTMLEQLAGRLELAESLRIGRATMLEPQDLPGRYGRVVKAIDRVLAATNCPAAVGGGWAVWRHGYVGRVTQDIDIVLPADAIDEFLRVAAVSGFDVLPVPAGLWPKLTHKDTDIQVDLLPEGQRPGTPAKPAPTTIPHPVAIGASGTSLRYIALPALIELKLAAGRTQDEADVVQLIQANADQLAAIRQHLQAVHPNYVLALEQLEHRARDEKSG
jgi:hypothetical protein